MSISWSIANTLQLMLVDSLAPFCVSIEPTGQVRRKRPLITEIELIVMPAYRAEQLSFGTGQAQVRHSFDDLLREALEEMVKVGAFVWQVDEKGNHKTTQSAYRLRLTETPIGVILHRITEPDQMGMAQFIHTGPPLYVEAMLRGWPITDYATDIEGDRYGFLTEQDLYQFLDEPYVKPEDRSGA